MRNRLSMRKWATLAWTIWMMALFGDYFYHMLRLTDRWLKGHMLVVKGRVGKT